MNTKYQSAYKKSIDGNKLTGGLGSTPDVDRDGDIVSPMGIKLMNFLKNPQLLWSHDIHGLPIGKVTDVRVSEKGLEFDAEFAVDENPFAKKVRDLMKGGFLNSFSIGFIPRERENETITESELIEISVVNVPANPQALLSREYKSFQKEISKKQLSRTQKKIKILNSLYK